MLIENEVIMFLIGSGVMVFMLGNRARLKALPAPNILVAGFSFLLAAWILTIAEGFFFATVLNYLEHIFYSISAILVAVWCWQAFIREREAG
ncbi:MAG: hypothetical protein PVH45_04970 [Candidatus Omnitrophota bacterium]|jgi:hypothetical protein